MTNRTLELMNLFGWKGGTIHQVHKELENRGLISWVCSNPASCHFHDCFLQVSENKYKNLFFGVVSTGSTLWKNYKVN